MQPPSLLLPSPASFSFLPFLSLEAYFRKHCKSFSTVTPSWTKLPLKCSHFSGNIPPLQSTRTEVQATAEAILDDSDFVEVGYLYNVHGLKGELHVKPSTNFPELRFSKPGTRWLRVRAAGKETIQEVELIKGRSNPGQKSWILSFGGIDTVDKANRIVGSTLLVKETDRPILEKDEFYIPDLVGMRVFLKETGQLVGTVVDVFKTGANDLLRVMLNSAEGRLNHSGSSDADSCASGPLVWIPFVKAIVPDVEMSRREMQITPPEGLLELNIPLDRRSKKERRLLEWKQKKKAQRRFIAAKKKLTELGQRHLLQGFSSGDKAQKSLLANQIASINFKLFQQAIRNSDEPFYRYNLTDFINANLNGILNNAVRISSEDMLEANHELYDTGVHLMSEGKVAIFLVMDDTKYHGRDHDSDFVGSGSVGHPSYVLHLQELLLNDKKFSRTMEQCHSSTPLVLISTSQDIQSCQELFSNHDYFGFDPKKVWFFEEEKLPVVSSPLTEQNVYKILLKSPWEILQLPVGSGGVISLLSSHAIVDSLTEMGVQYVEVCSLGQRSTVGHPLPFMLVDSQNAEIGIKILNDQVDDYNFDMIFSLSFLKKMSRQIDKLQFSVIPKLNSYIEQIDGEWINIHPTAPNSYQMQCSIYSCLNFSSPGNICLMHIANEFSK